MWGRGKVGCRARVRLGVGRTKVGSWGGGKVGCWEG